MKRILLAEDEEVLRMLVVDTLEEEDYEVDEAADGTEAVQLFEENSYDLLVLDYMMPGLTGLEVIDHVRQKDKDVKILMLSAKSQQYEQEKVIEAGANYFMAKPFSPMELKGKLGDILNER
ncbi:response regulator transcription factor [Robertmurraya sp. FSL R5-0851]|uniref:response regulator transcription factor n=1 Tax=Robertmurraya sp. FSL R5-0851 TaxID=2921584 RepID=UPI0009278EBA|nr:response regulator with CheY-like receiver domain and winged-helix DNA-binding domain [Mycobacteroides abscessus subsp. abscessus]